MSFLQGLLGNSNGAPPGQLNPQQLAAAQQQAMPWLSASRSAANTASRPMPANPYSTPGMSGTINVNGGTNNPSLGSFSPQKIAGPQGGTQAAPMATPAPAQATRTAPDTRQNPALGGGSGGGQSAVNIQGNYQTDPNQSAYQFAYDPGKGYSVSDPTKGESSYNVNNTGWSPTVQSAENTFQSAYGLPAGAFGSLSPAFLAALTGSAPPAQQTPTKNAPGYYPQSY